MTRIKVMSTSPYKDAGDMMQAEGGESFGKALREAKPAAAWVIDNVETHPEMAKVDIATPEGKQDVVEFLYQMLLALPAIERGVYTMRLAGKLGVSHDDLRRALNEIHRLQTAVDEQQAAINYRRTFNRTVEVPDDE